MNAKRILVLALATLLVAASGERRVRASAAPADCHDAASQPDQFARSASARRSSGLPGDARHIARLAGRGRLLLRNASNCRRAVKQQFPRLSPAAAPSGVLMPTSALPPACRFPVLSTAGLSASVGPRWKRVPRLPAQAAGFFFFDSCRRLPPLRS